MKAYRLENPGDFPAASVEGTQMDVNDGVVAEIEEIAANQVGKSGEARFGFNSKGICRENVRADLSEISGISDSMSYEFPGIDLLFHIPKNLTDAAMLALANAFHTKATEYKGDFIRYGLANTFLGDLQTAITEFEASLAPPEMAKDAQVEATAQLGESVRKGMISRRILMGVMKVKYKNSPAKWQAWLSASHIEKDAPKDDDDEPTPVTP
jgi:hypothetical protein